MSLNSSSGIKDRDGGHLTVANRNLSKARKDISHDLSQLCRDLIRTPSPSGREGRLAELAKNRMEEFGYDRVTIDSIGNVIGIKDGLKPLPLLIFDGHMDTVPPGERQHWRNDPFSGKIIGGSIFGRGAVDMKGALAAMILIPRIMRSLGWTPRGSFATVLVVLEEPCEGLGIRNVIEDGLKPDAVVLGEPTNLCLMLGHRGRFEISVRTHGKTCHSSMPEEGTNPIYEMAQIIGRLEKLSKRLPHHPTLGPASISGFRITSSPSEGNVIPDMCELLLDRRTLPGENKAKILGEIESVILQERRNARASVLRRKLETYTGRRLEVEQAFPSWLLERRHWFVSLARNAVEKVTGRRPTTGTWRFGTDGAYTAGVRKIPTIGFGPGQPETAHGPDENVSLSDVTSATMAYASIARNWP